MKYFAGEKKKKSFVEMDRVLMNTYSTFFVKSWMTKLDLFIEFLLVTYVRHKSLASRAVVVLTSVQSWIPTSSVVLG